MIKKEDIYVTDGKMFKVVTCTYLFRRPVGDKITPNGGEFR